MSQEHFNNNEGLEYPEGSQNQRTTEKMMVIEEPANNQIFSGKTKPQHKMVVLGEFGGILGSQEQWNAKHEELERNKIIEAPPLSEEEKEIMRIQAYIHSLDILVYTPGKDRDMFEEDQKDRQRANPIAQQLKRLPLLLERERKNFPNDQILKDQKIEIINTERFIDQHPTVMLPPANPDLKNELDHMLEQLKVSAKSK